MSCTCCDPTYQKEFDKKSAQKELQDYRKNGPKKNSLKLINALKEYDLTKDTLLDIGGGIGTIQVELIKGGIAEVTAVEFSDGYLEVAQNLTTQEKIQDKVRYVHGDYLDHCEDVPQSDIVTLDKSICCYKDFIMLVTKSVAKSKRLYGIVIPRDKWWVKAVNGIGNVIRKLIGTRFHSFIHPVASIEQIIFDAGFKRGHLEHQREWMVAVYERR